MQGLEAPDGEEDDAAEANSNKRKHLKKRLKQIRNELEALADRKKQLEQSVEDDDDVVECTGEVTWAERDAALRRRAVVLD